MKIVSIQMSMTLCTLYPANNDNNNKPIYMVIYNLTQLTQKTYTYI